MDWMIDQFKALRDWLDSHRPYVFELVRIYLGVGLVVKGMQFIQDRSFLTEMLTKHDHMDFLATAMAHYIPLAHLGGGALLALGLLTRISALFQLPILFGATFIVYMPEGFFTYPQEFEFTALVLFLLLLVVVHGGGPWSVDHFVWRAALRDHAEGWPDRDGPGPSTGREGT